MACPQWHCRAWARVVESGPDGGQVLAVGPRQRLEELPDPRSPRGRIYPLACLIAIALCACAFTSGGNDRLTAVGQWISRASLERLPTARPWRTAEMQLPFTLRLTAYPGGRFGRSHLDERGLPSPVVGARGR
jgi:hypothetical protein